MIWSILGFLFILYVIYSLSTIKYQQKLIMKHLNIKEEPQKITDEEIEKELQNDLKS